jgi:hypothetical protein
MKAVLANSKVVANRDFSGADRQDLARVFIKAFDSRASPFPIDFEDVWQFLDYSTKGNVLQKLKRCFQEGIDFAFAKGHVMKDQTSGQITGMDLDHYSLTTPAFEHFCLSAPGERGKLVRGFFLTLKEQYFRTLEGLGKRRPSDLIDENGAFLAMEEVKLAQELAINLKGKEKEVQLELQLDEGGAMEVACEYGVVDLLTDDEVIEVKEVHLWKHALGQIMAYSDCFPEHAARIHLFSDQSCAPINLAGIYKMCSKVGVRVTLDLNNS